jgi:hypothetical protein
MGQISITNFLKKGILRGYLDQEPPRSQNSCQLTNSRASFFGNVENIPGHYQFRSRRFLKKLKAQDVIRLAR